MAQHRLGLFTERYAWKYESSYTGHDIKEVMLPLIKKKFFSPVESKEWLYNLRQRRVV